LYDKSTTGGKSTANAQQAIHATSSQGSK